MECGRGRRVKLPVETLVLHVVVLGFKTGSTSNSIFLLKAANIDYSTVRDAE